MPCATGLSWATLRRMVDESCENTGRFRRRIDMDGPGEYLPDVTEGITQVEDLPKAKVAQRSRNYRRRSCPEPDGFGRHRQPSFAPYTSVRLVVLSSNDPRSSGQHRMLGVDVPSVVYHAWVGADRVTDDCLSISGSSLKPVSLAMARGRRLQLSLADKSPRTPPRFSPTDLLRRQGTPRTSQPNLRRKSS